MSIDILKRISMMILLILIQVLVLNHIHLFGCAVPLLYIYFVLRTNREYPKWASLVWAFVLGLGIDSFSNTPGLAAASLTLVAALQPYLLNMFISHDNNNDITPSIKSLGFGNFATFTLICTAILCIAFFSLEAFNFFNWQQWLYNIGGSTLITVLFILVIENVRRS